MEILIQPPVDGNFGGSWTIIRDLALRCGNGKLHIDSNPNMNAVDQDDPLFDANGHGIVLRGRALIENCHISGFRHDGVHIDALNKPSNANNFEIHNCRMDQNGRHGLFAIGPDANAGRIIGADCSDNAVWGVYDHSSLGSTYLGCHCSGNGRGSYKQFGPLAYSMFINCYAEDDQLPAEIDYPSVVLGGILPVKGNAAWLTQSGAPPGITSADYDGLTQGVPRFPNSVQGESLREPKEAYVSGLLGSPNVKDVAIELHIIAPKGSYNPPLDVYRLQFEAGGKVHRKDRLLWWSWIYANQVELSISFEFANSCELSRDGEQFVA